MTNRELLDNLFDKVLEKAEESLDRESITSEDIAKHEAYTNVLELIVKEIAGL